MNFGSLNQLVGIFHKIIDPINPKGVRNDFHGMIILIFLGQLDHTITYWPNSTLIKKVLAHSTHSLKFKKRKPQTTPRRLSRMAGQ